MVIQQQHSLLFQASWGSLKMKPKRKKDKRNTKKRYKTEGREIGVNRNRNKGHVSGTLIASLQALLSIANSLEIFHSLRSLLTDMPQSQFRSTSTSLYIIDLL